METPREPMRHPYGIPNAEPPKEKAKFYIARLWCVIEGVQTFFPLYADSMASALNHLLIPRHQRILREWDDTNPIVHLSIYAVPYEYLLVGNGGHFQASLTLPQEIASLIDNPNTKLAEFQPFINHYGENHIYKFDGGTLFVREVDASRLNEIYRFTVNVPNSLEFLSYYTKAIVKEDFVHGILQKRFEEYLTPVTYKLSIAKAIPVNASPQRQEVQHSGTLESADDAVSLDYLKTLPRDVAYQIAINIHADDLRSICTVSSRMNNLFCSDESLPFWRAKVNADLGQIPDIDIYVLNVLDLKRLYYKMLVTRRALNLVRKKFSNLGLQSAVFLLTGLRDSKGNFPFELNKVLQNLANHGWPDMIRYVEIDDGVPVYRVPVHPNAEASMEVFQIMLAGMLARIAKSEESYTFVYPVNAFYVKESLLYAFPAELFRTTIVAHVTMASIYPYRWIDQSKLPVLLEAIQQIIIRDYPEDYAHARDFIEKQSH
jgi:hypothetical protein